MRSPVRLLLLLLLLPLTFFLCAHTLAEDVFEQSPISYSTAVPQDAVAALKLKLASGQVRFEGDEKQIVRSLLSALGVPEASQMLVFSKTSFQKDRIDPAHPRAVYFSDDVYVGWCPGGLVELAAIDPILGPVFYSVDPHNAGRDVLRFERDADCLRCHGGAFIRDIPGLLARSVFTDSAGQLKLALGSELVDSTTPLEKRWGGWYVTARHAGLHRGNLVLTSDQEPDSNALSTHANLTTLDNLVDTRPYLRPSSDVTALLVFEHQVFVQNALTRASQQCLRMIDYQKRLQAELKERVTDEPTYESVRHVFASASQEVLDALLSKGEAALPQGGIEGVGGFANAFNPPRKTASTQPQPSLRELDLQQRLFRYRCSYLIQSTTFDRLQPTLRRRVLQRLWRVLTDPTSEPRYDYLESAERDTIRQILTTTLRNLPPGWRKT